MKVGVFNCKAYERDYLQKHAKNCGFEIHCIECKLSPDTAVVAEPFDAVSVFVDDIVDARVLDSLSKTGTEHIALRCPGVNNIDLAYASTLGISVSRVPCYSPSSVAEHTLALILALNRKLYRAYNRILENNFELDGLLGFNLEHKTVGIIGTGNIGSRLVKVLSGLDCRILCIDPAPSHEVEKLGAHYVELDTLLAESDIISLHCPLNEASHHLIDHTALQKMKDGVMLINTSQAGLINIKALLAGLKSQKVGYFGFDVYDMRSEGVPVRGLDEPVTEDILARLNTFPNVLITSHQGFFTQESLQQIADTTLRNLQCFFAGKVDSNTFL